MAWLEAIGRRTRRNKFYQDDVDPRKRAITATFSTLHFPSVLDSGVCDAEINFTPQRVINAQFDGWRVTQNSWHYGLGQPTGLEDGWVYFGGRQGAHRFGFRLERIGYVHWPTRAWDDLGGLATYDRANLTRQAHVQALGAPNDDEVVTGTTATWTALWSPPGGGDVSARWFANGTGLKESIAVDQTARDWIDAHPPATPLGESYLTLLMRLDVSDVPRVYRADVLQDMAGDFADDGERIELRDAEATEHLLGYLPLSEVYVELAGGERVALPLRKRFYRQTGVNYLLIGVRCDLLAAMPDGTLVFDPTIDENIDASGDDGEIAHHTSGINTSGTAASLGYYATNTWEWDVWLRYDDISGLGGGSITTAYLKDCYISGGVDTPNVDIFGDDSEAPTAPTTYAQYTGKARTSESVNFIPTEAWPEDSPSIVDIIQELADSYDPSAIQLFLENTLSAGDHYTAFYMWDQAPQGDYSASLYIEFDEAAAGNPWHYYAQQ